MDASAARPDPIPVYAEMSSLNPVFVLAGYDGDVQALADSVTGSSGQLCIGETDGDRDEQLSSLIERGGKCSQFDARARVRTLGDGQFFPLRCGNDLELTPGTSNLRASRVTDGILGSFRFDRNGDIDPPVMPVERLAATPRGAPIDGAVFDRLITIPEALARP